jgi:hypothetical protein
MSAAHRRYRPISLAVLLLWLGSFAARLAG